MKQLLLLVFLTTIVSSLSLYVPVKGGGRHHSYHSQSEGKDKKQENTVTEKDLILNVNRNIDATRDQSSGATLEISNQKTNSESVLKDREQKLSQEHNHKEIIFSGNTQQEKEVNKQNEHTVTTHEENHHHKDVDGEKRTYKKTVENHSQDHVEISEQSISSGDSILNVNRESKVEDEHKILLTDDQNTRKILEDENRNKKINQEESSHFVHSSESHHSLPDNVKNEEGKTVLKFEKHDHEKNLHRYGEIDFGKDKEQEKAVINSFTSQIAGADINYQQKQTGGEVIINEEEQQQALIPTAIPTTVFGSDINGQDVNIVSTDQQIKISGSGQEKQDEEKNSESNSGTKISEVLKNDKVDISGHDHFDHKYFHGHPHDFHHQENFDQKHNHKVDISGHDFVGHPHYHGHHPHHFYHQEKFGDNHKVDIGGHDHFSHKHFHGHEPHSFHNQEKSNEKKDNRFKQDDKKVVTEIHHEEKNSGGSLVTEIQEQEKNSGGSLVTEIQREEKNSAGSSGIEGTQFLKNDKVDITGHDHFGSKHSHEHHSHDFHNQEKVNEKKESNVKQEEKKPVTEIQHEEKNSGGSSVTEIQREEKNSGGSLVTEIQREEKNTAGSSRSEILKNDKVDITGHDEFDHKHFHAHHPYDFHHQEKFDEKKHHKIDVADGNKFGHKDFHEHHPYGLHHHGHDYHHSLEDSFGDGSFEDKFDYFDQHGHHDYPHPHPHYQHYHHYGPPPPHHFHQHGGYSDKKNNYKH